MVFTSVFWIRTSGLFDRSAAAGGLSPRSHSANFARALSGAKANAAADQLGSVISSQSLLKLGDAKTLGHLTTLTPTASGFYVLDSARQQVIQFDKRGAFLGVFGRKGVGPGAYAWPSGLTRVADSRDPQSQDFWLSDFRQSRINRLAGDGTYRASFPISEQDFSAKEITQNPTTGEIYICGNTTSAHAVSVLHSYDRDGKFSASFFNLSGPVLALNLDSTNDCLFTTSVEARL
jgi:hypothetical protein